MKDIKLATYLTNNTYQGHNHINQYHWEVGFECYKVDMSEERAMGILINGQPPVDTFELVFINYKGIGVRRSRFTSRDEANAVVKNYINRGYRKVV